ncbi:MAG: hypothetical protein ACI4WR_01905 [Bulleidia sp.]
MIPKSLSPAHMAENLNIYDFQLSNDERDGIRRPDPGKDNQKADRAEMREMLMNALKVHD